MSLQAKAICILKVYDIRCGFHALSTLWRQAGKEHYPTVSSSFVRFKFMVHSLAEGGRWCPGLAIDVRLLDRGSFNIGIAFFHVTTCFILNLSSLNISYGKRLI